MRRTVTAALTLLLLLTQRSPASAAAETDVQIAEKPEPLSDIERDAFALADKIDQYIEARWKDRRIQPAPLSDDSEFLRRAYLDLNGRIPGLGLARDFPQMGYSHKRRELLRQLVKQPRFAQQLAVVWRNILLPPLGNTAAVFDPNFFANFDRWLRDELSRPLARFDRIARQLVSGPSRANDPGNVFYLVNEYRTENLAASTSRLFLGVKLECAQCHDHPFAKWSRKQFWEYAAFFGGVNRRSPDGAGGREISIPNTNKKAQARFPDGTEPKFVDRVDSRALLLDWMTAPENPFFARAAVNRMWEHYFGTGLIDPLDEGSDDNPPSHPELLDELAREFAAHQFDLRFLSLALTASRTYQRSSAMTDKSQVNPRLFARAVVRGLTPQQVLDSMLQAGSHGPDRLNQGVGVDPFGRPTRSLRGSFMDRFPYQAKKSEASTSILQALFLMNSEVMEVMIDADPGGNLAWLMSGAGKVSTGRRVEQLFLLTLSRPPTAEERARFVAYLDKGGPSGDARKAVSDVFWALLNCSEFALNH
jgi:hypothetical protein